MLMRITTMNGGGNKGRRTKVSTPCRYRYRHGYRYRYLCSTTLRKITVLNVFVLVFFFSRAAKNKNTRNGKKYSHTENGFFRMSFLNLRSLLVFKNKTFLIKIEIYFNMRLYETHT